MNPKIEKWLKKKVDSTVDISGRIINNLSLKKIKEVIWTEEQLYKFKEASLKGIKLVFQIIFGVSVSLTFLLFFPIIIGISYERVTLVVLVVIMLLLKFGKIKVKIED